MIWMLKKSIISISRRNTDEIALAKTAGIQRDPKHPCLQFTLVVNPGNMI